MYIKLAIGNKSTVKNIMIDFSRSCYVCLFSMFSNSNFCSLVDKWRDGRNLL
jgi:hypothetical protein